jgi:hypothetical protein
MPANTDGLATVLQIADIYLKIGAARLKNGALNHSHFQQVTENKS